MRTCLPLLLALLVGWWTGRAGGAPEAAAAVRPPDFTAAVEAADPAVVHVTTTLPADRAPRSRDDAIGSGFVYDASGVVVTSRHVVQGARAVHVEVPGRGTFEAQVVGHDEAT